MSHPPLKRHPALQPFSRDHFSGLFHAQQLIRSAGSDSGSRQKAIAAFLRAWSEEIEDHFGQEERLLIDLMTPALREHLRRDHRELRAFASQAAREIQDCDADWTRRLGEKLHDHIRWEERELFPAIEGAASEEALKDIERHTMEMESRRPRSSARACPSGEKRDEG